MKSGEKEIEVRQRRPLVDPNAQLPTPTPLQYRRSSIVRKEEVEPIIPESSKEIVEEPKEKKEIVGGISIKRKKDGDRKKRIDDRGKKANRNVKSKIIEESADIYPDGFDISSVSGYSESSFYGNGYQLWLDTIYEMSITDKSLDDLSSRYTKDTASEAIFNMSSKNLKLAKQSLEMEIMALRFTPQIQKSGDKCKKCKLETVYYVSAQLRGLDEGKTAFYFCDNPLCKAQWREN